MASCCGSTYSPPPPLKFGWPYPGKAQQPARAALPIPVSVCNNFGVWLSMFGDLLTCAQMLMHAIAHGHRKTESALRGDSGRRGAGWWVGGVGRGGVGGSITETGTRTRVSIAPGILMGRCSRS